MKKAFDVVVAWFLELAGCLCLLVRYALGFASLAVMLLAVTAFVCPPPASTPNISNIGLREDAGLTTKAILAVGLPLCSWNVQDMGVFKVATTPTKDGSLTVVGIAGKWYRI